MRRLTTLVLSSATISHQANDIVNLLKGGDIHPDEWMSSSLASSMTLFATLNVAFFTSYNGLSSTFSLYQQLAPLSLSSLRDTVYFLLQCPSPRAQCHLIIPNMLQQILKGVQVVLVSLHCVTAMWWFIQRLSRSDGVAGPTGVTSQQNSNGGNGAAGPEKSIAS